MKSSVKLQQNKIERLYNQNVPQQRVESFVLAPAEGPLDFQAARHLLSRCLFGFGQTELDAVKNMPVDEAVDLLLDELPLPQPPLTTDGRDAGSRIGESWINQPHHDNYNSYRLVSLHAWWFGQILASQMSLREKMVLFWHNHFVVESGAVSRAGFLYQYNDCLRKNAFGNFRKLTEEITILPAMLRYLNGDVSVAGSPNENYARKLLECFTLGLDEEGLNYTEIDVVEAAKVLTGWEIDSEGAAVFNAAKHDASSKIFSEAFSHAEIGNEGANEYKALIRMIFEQEETARFLVRKIYRWFVWYVIDDEIETKIIEPLAEIFRENNYEIKPLLSVLLKSQHFFDEKLRGCLIKNPVDFVAGAVKNTGFSIPGKEQLVAMYGLWNHFFNQATNQEMKLGNPPDAGGWPAFYLAPRFHQLWINAATLAQKSTFTGQLLSADGIVSNKLSFKVNLIALAKTTTKPSDANVLVTELAARFFPRAGTTQEIDRLKEVLLPGLPGFEWTSEWNKYQSNPDDETQRALIENKLRELVNIMFRMPNYHLS